MKTFKTFLTYLLAFIMIIIIIMTDGYKTDIAYFFHIYGHKIIVFGLLILLFIMIRIMVKKYERILKEKDLIYKDLLEKYNRLEKLIKK